MDRILEGLAPHPRPLSLKTGRGEEGMWGLRFEARRMGRGGMAAQEQLGQLFYTGGSH